MKELKNHSGLDWHAWFWVDKEEFAGEWAIGRLRYRIEKAVGRDDEGRLILMVWVNQDRFDHHKFTQTFYELGDDEYAVFLDRAIRQGEVEPSQRQHLLDRANAPFVPPWDISKAVVVYRDARYTLGQRNGQPYLIADGRKYILTCHPYEPCLYITDESGTMTTVHNAFDPFDVLNAFSRSETICSITGRELDAADFCRMVEYAAGRVEINFSDAETALGDRGSAKPGAAEPETKGSGGRIEDSRCPDDPFYGLIAEYPDCVVDYCIVSNEQDRGRNAHWMALIWACRRLFVDDEDESIWRYDVCKAVGKPVGADALFAAAKDKRGANYRGAFLYPPHGGRLTDRDFDRVNAALFPNGTDGLEVYEWTTDWSAYFDDGHEWWGALCYTVYDRSLDRFVVILASATD